MIRRSRVRQRTTTASDVAPVPDNFHEWICSLPWVVENLSRGRPPGTRLFHIDCPDLGRPRTFLVTGSTAVDALDGAYIAGVLPSVTARRARASAHGRHPANAVPSRDVFLRLAREVSTGDKRERFVLAAYMRAWEATNDGE